MSASALAYYVPDFRVSISGKEEKSNEVRQYTISFQISEQLQAPAEFSFTLIDKFDIESQEFKWLDDPDLQPGTVVSVELGYVESVQNGKVSGLREIIKNGVIKTITTSGFSQSEAPTVTITGYDATHDWLSKVPEIKDNTTSIELTGDDVVNKIAEGTKFTPKIDSNPKYKTRLTKSSSTTYGAILKERAESIGFEFLPSRNSFYFVNPRDKSKSTSHTFEWGKDIIQFVPSINTSEIVTGVKVRYMPHNSKVEVEVKAETGKEDRLNDGTTASDLAKKLNNGKEKEINDRNFASREEAEAKAKAELNIIGDKLVTGTCSVVGNPDIELGQIIELQKLGKQFSGKYYVTRVSHSITDAGYITQLSVRKNTLAVSK